MKYKSIILAFLTGILLSTSYVPFYPWAVFFCLVPLFSAWLKEDQPRRVFFLGWLSQFVFNMIGFHWIYHTAAEFGHLPFIPSAIALVGFASFESLDLPIAGLLVALLKKKYKFKPLWEITLYALMFFIVQALYPTIFPWNLAYPWYWANWPAVQWADVVGFEGLSLFTLLAQVLFWQIWQVRKERRVVFRLSVLFLGVFIALNITGRKKALAIEEKVATESGRELKLLLVQANIGNLEKAYAEKGMQYQGFIVNEYLNLAREGLAKHPESELVIFPETALPVSLNSEYVLTPDARLVVNFVKETKLPLLTGAYADSAANLPYNSVFLFGSDAQLLGYYNKTHLLAFGEFIPGGDLFPILYEWMPFISHFGRGPGPSVLHWDGLKFGIQICYEGLYPKFSRGLSDKNANLFFNATNDSWFGKTFEPQQHMIMTAARAIEFRRPMIRATNTGISTVITQTGKLLTQSPLHEKWYESVKLKLEKDPEPTLYARFPYVVFLLSLFLFGLCFYLGRVKVVESSAS